YVVLSPGGGWRSKCWPPERFGELCQKIREQLNLRCVINYGPGEETLAAAVKSASGDADPFLYDGELGPLMALLQGARCIVGGDTGPLHLAIALGTKPVAIFGPTNPARNGPYPPQPFVLRDPAADTTHKRETETNPSLLKISVAQVFDAVKLRLGASA
ncbi:MAG TPA: glycosyltransferase family 9 protein, partial [Candidatus Acidoferrum sp.]|nr:glycosyltransferase family 9 protein [Candidatus Acidoferrum sp.]